MPILQAYLPAAYPAVTPFSETRGSDSLLFALETLTASISFAELESLAIRREGDACVYPKGAGPIHPIKSAPKSEMLQTDLSSTPGAYLASLRSQNGDRGTFPFRFWEWEAYGRGQREYSAGERTGICWQQCLARSRRTREAVSGREFSHTPEGCRGRRPFPECSGKIS